MKALKISDWKTKLTATLLYMAVAGVLAAFRMPCLFQHFLHIPCPGCGMVRAVTRALHLDLAGAFHYHFMFWSLPVLYLYFLFDGRIFGKLADRIVLISIAAGFAAHWVYLFFRPL